MRKIPRERFVPADPKTILASTTVNAAPAVAREVIAPLLRVAVEIAVMPVQNIAKPMGTKMALASPLKIQEICIAQDLVLITSARRKHTLIMIRITIIAEATIVAQSTFFNRKIPALTVVLFNPVIATIKKRTLASRIAAGGAARAGALSLHPKFAAMA